MVSAIKTLKRLSVAVLLVAASVSSIAATKDVRTVVAQVGAEWGDEAKLRKFHESLVEKFKDSPSFEQMVAKMKWVAVVDVAEAKRAWTVAARVEDGTEVKKGDVVEIDYRGDPFKVRSFEEMPRVRRVVCKMGAPDYEPCKKATAMGAFDVTGKRTSWGD